MAKSSRSSRPKAIKPELKPLDPYLAELLNPAINRERAAKGDAKGVGERPQAEFDAGSVETADPALAQRLGLAPSPGGGGSDGGSRPGRGDTGSRRTANRSAGAVTPSRRTSSVDLPPPGGGEGGDDDASLASDGVSATVAALSALLTSGN